MVQMHCFLWKIVNLLRGSTDLFISNNFTEMYLTEMWNWRKLTPKLSG